MFPYNTVVKIDNALLVNIMSKDRYKTIILSAALPTGR